jgi:signal transduction histidine kinase/CheY-like chemotaxis protein
VTTIFAGPDLRPPSPWQQDDIDSVTFEAMRHEQMLDLALRLAHAIYAYPLLLIVLGLTTTWPEEHPFVWWPFTIWIVAASSIRGYLIRRREYYSRRTPTFWWATVRATTIAISTGFGALLMLGSLWYPIEEWNLMAPLVFVVGISAASLIALSPDYGLMRAHIVLLILPGTLAAVYKGDPQAVAFAIAGSILAAYLLVQGATLNKNYVALHWEQAVSRKRAVELEKARRAAEAASEAKSQFLASLSHEIRTPMNGILGMARLALDANPSPGVRDSIETLEQCAIGLLQILNDMLDFSKIEAGKLELDRIAFAPQDVLRDASRLLEAEARSKGLTLTIAQPLERIFVDGDPVRLRQVLINLIGNAIKFTERGQVTATLTVIPTDQPSIVDLEYAVEDTGIGIDPGVQQIIFEAFRQADGSVTRRFGGTGLGLAICARLVEAMGSHINVDSAPGHGSRFSFTLRHAMRIEPPVPLPLESPDPAARPFVPLSILVAEDNPVNQRLIQSLLTRQGHQVLVAGNGREAVEAVKAGTFDLILMDISMPDVDGMEATRLLREWEMEHALQPIPILALTANAMSGDRERFTAAGMDGYLAKPFSPEQLYRIVQRYAPPMPAAGNHSSYSN